MPSDTPMEGRCGSQVISKVGLEVHDSVLDEVFVDPDVRPEDRAADSKLADEDAEYTEQMVRVVLTDGEFENEHEPDYDEVLPLLRKEWEVAAVIVEHETDDAIEHERIEIEDDDPYVTNRGTVLDGYCMRWPMDNGTCYVHQGGAEEDNAYRMKHGMYANRSKFMQWLKDEGRDDDVEFIHAMVDSWLEDAPFDRNNVAKVNELYRCATDQLRLWLSIDEYVEKSGGAGDPEGQYSGLAYDQVIGTDDEGEPIEIFDESALNLPYSRLDRDVGKKLKDMGIYDSPEKQDAEATQSLAQALSGE